MCEYDFLTVVFLSTSAGVILTGAIFLIGHLFRSNQVVSSCEHDWVQLDRISVQNPGEPILAIIYVHRCNKCGTVTRDRISNKG